jgi:glycosyltransferase involved in cell wall biosynthesis
MLRNCDVFLISSTLEACPFTLLEAMRQGAPIVASNMPPMPEFCGDAATYVEPYDVDRWAEAACEIIFSPERRAQLQARSRERSNRFTWAKSVDRLVDTLRKTACGS